MADRAAPLLHNDTSTTADRVAGLPVLLYGQFVARIVRLTHTGSQVRLLLGHQPLTLDRLLLEVVADRRGLSGASGRTNRQEDERSG